MIVAIFPIVTYYGKFSSECNGDICFLLKAQKKVKNLMIEQHFYEYKKAPLDTDFLTDFIRTHLCASMDGTT